MARCSVSLLLLLLLRAGVLCGDQEGPPAADLTSESSSLDILWSGIGLTVRSIVEPPIEELNGRLTGLQVQLSSVGSKLEAQVQSAEENLEARVESAEAKLENRVEIVDVNLETRLESAEKRLEDRVQSAESKLDAHVESSEAKLEARMDSIQSDQANQTLELTGRLNQIESVLEGVQTRLEGVQSQLEGVQSRLEEVQSEQRPVRDCSDLPAGTPSGVYLLQPGLRQPVPAFCDQETDGGGWTVIQRRADIKPRQDFLLGWEAYKWGFGELDAELWWGLENLWLTTSLLDRQYQIRINLGDFDGEKRYAVYQRFKVASEEDGYRLTALNYTGDAGDHFGRFHSGMQFSTMDRDQDADPDRDCAENFKGGWWYKNCHESNLNGLYLSGNHRSYADGVNWYGWRGHRYSLKSVEMKIKPSKKL